MLKGEKTSLNNGQESCFGTFMLNFVSNFIALPIRANYSNTI